MAGNEAGEVGMSRRVITDEAELRRVVLYVKARVRTIDELYRAIVRIAVVDLDDLRRVLRGERLEIATIPTR